MALESPEQKRPGTAGTVRGMTTEGLVPMQGEAKQTSTEILADAFEALERVGQCLRLLDVDEDHPAWLAFHNLDGTLGDINV